MSGPINKYNEFGIGGGGGRFHYTGQVYVPSLGLQYYKARMYSGTLGRFLQADPIGYAGGMNMYNYVGADPVNYRDPSGLLSSEQCWSYTIPGNVFSTGDPDGPGGDEPGWGATGNSERRGCFTIPIPEFPGSSYFGGQDAGGGGGQSRTADNAHVAVPCKYITPGSTGGICPSEPITCADAQKWLNDVTNIESATAQGLLQSILMMANVDGRVRGAVAFLHGIIVANAISVRNTACKKK